MDIEDTGSGDGRPPGCRGNVAVSIYRYFPHGGLQKLMMDTILELQHRNFAVTIFCISWETEHIPANVAVRRLRISGSSSAVKAHKFDLALARVLKKRDFDFHLSFNTRASARSNLWALAALLLPEIRRRRTATFSGSFSDSQDIQNMVTSKLRCCNS